MTINKYEITFANGKTDVVEAWKIEVEKNVAMFFDGRGEVVAVFLEFSSIKRLPNKDGA